MSELKKSVVRKSTIHPRVQLGAAAAAGAAAWAGGGTAQASVISVQEPTPIVINSTNTEQGIDLDGDGATDFYVDYSIPEIFTTETNLKIFSNGLGTDEFAIDSTTNDGLSNAVAFSAMDSIGATLPGGDSYTAGAPFVIAYIGGNLFAPAQTVGIAPPTTDDPAGGNFTPSAEKYIGVSFNAGSNTSATPNYGYIAFETTDGSSASNLTGEILGYGYETQPGVAIAAGAVPEPSSLALLAAGAAGLARYRRRPSRLSVR